MRHGYRGSRRGSMRPVIQSFKYVVEEAPASVAAGATNTLKMIEGEDSAAAGQTGVTDVKIPTGSIVKAINIDFSAANLVNIAGFVWVSIQKVRSGQSTISPRIVGGNPQRNQVFYQRMFGVGLNQNSNFHKLFKIPPKFQRMSDGDKWNLVTNSDIIRTECAEFIYKFYR